MTSGTADLTVDPNTRYQQFTGFGGIFNEMGWDALSELGADDRDAGIEAPLRCERGGELRLRTAPMGASDYAMSWYTLAETAGDLR